MLWKLIWFIVPGLLGVTRSFVERTIDAVENIEDSDLPAEEKREIVMAVMKQHAKEEGRRGYGVVRSKRVLNVILELSVNYVRQMS